MARSKGSRQDDVLQTSVSSRILRTALDSTPIYALRNPAWNLTCAGAKVEIK